MFVQVIHGRTSDPDGLAHRLDEWESTIRPGAIGYLGSTGGTASDGTVVALIRFESREQAEQNGARPEQSAWWADTSKYFDEVAFHNCDEVDVQLEGGSDSAGFVQVITGHCSDRDRLRALEAAATENIKEHRPDLIGSVRAWEGDLFYEAAYFTSEAAARAGEARMAEVPAEIRANLEEWTTLISDVSYIDLTNPQMRS